MSLHSGKGRNSHTGEYNRRLSEQRHTQTKDPFSPRLILRHAGERFGRLVVVKFDRKTDGTAGWRCRCDCGSEVVVAGSKLTAGHTQSCGCLVSEVAAANATETIPRAHDALKARRQSRTSCKRGHGSLRQLGARRVCDECLRESYRRYNASSKGRARNAKARTK